MCLELSLTLQVCADTTCVFYCSPLKLAIIPRTLESTVPQGRHVTYCQDLNATFYSMQDVLAETQSMGSLGVSMVVAGTLRVDVSFQPMHSEEIEEDIFLTDAVRDYPALPDLFRLVSYILFTADCMFTDPQSGPVTSSVLSALLISFLDVSPSVMHIPVMEALTLFDIVHARRLWGPGVLQRNVGCFLGMDSFVPMGCGPDRSAARGLRLSLLVAVTHLSLCESRPRYILLLFAHLFRY